jgi:hypothetical protein
MTDQAPDLMTSREVAELFRVTLLAVARWRKRGLLDGAYISTPGGHPRYRRSEIYALYEGNGQKSQVTER